MVTDNIEVQFCTCISVWFFKTILKTKPAFFQSKVCSAQWFSGCRWFGSFIFVFIQCFVIFSTRSFLTCTYVVHAECFNLLYPF